MGMSHKFNLVPMQFREFFVIIVMDGLSKYKVEILYGKKMVKVNALEGGKSSFMEIESDYQIQ